MSRPRQLARSTHDRTTAGGAGRTGTARTSRSTIREIFTPGRRARLSVAGATPARRAISFALRPTAASWARWASRFAGETCVAGSGAGSESPGRPPDLHLPAETGAAAIAAAAEPPAGRRAVLFQHDRHWAATGALCSAWTPLTALVDVIEKSSLLNQSNLTTRHGSDTSKGVPARLAGRVGPGDDRSDRCRGADRCAQWSRSGRRSVSASGRVERRPRRPRIDISDSVGAVSICVSAAFR